MTSLSCSEIMPLKSLMTTDYSSPRVTSLLLLLLFKSLMTTDYSSPRVSTPRNCYLDSENRAVPSWLTGWQEAPLFVYLFVCVCVRVCVCRMCVCARVRAHVGVCMRVCAGAGMRCGF